MKRNTARFLLFLYILGVIVIPVLHHAGFVAPHENSKSLCVFEKIIQKFSPETEANADIDSDVCLICQLSATNFTPFVEDAVLLKPVWKEKRFVTNARVSKCINFSMPPSRAPPVS